MKYFSCIGKTSTGWNCTHHRWVCRQPCQHCQALSDRGSWAEWYPTAVELLAKKEATCWPQCALHPVDSSAGLRALAGWDLVPGLNRWERKRTSALVRFNTNILRNKTELVYCWTGANHPLISLSGRQSNKKPVGDWKTKIWVKLED